MAARRKLAGVLLALLAVWGQAYVTSPALARLPGPSGYARLARTAAEQRQLEHKGNPSRFRIAANYEQQAEPAYTQPALPVHPPRGPPDLL